MVECKNLLTNLIKHVFEKKDAESVKQIKESFKRDKALREAYYAVDNLQNGFSNDAKHFIEHNKSIYSKYKTRLKELYAKGEDLKGIDASISYIFNNDREAVNYDMYNEHYSKVEAHLLDNKSLFESTQKIGTLLEQAESLKDKFIFEKLCNAPSKADFFLDFKTETVLKIDAMIKEESDKEQKLLLYEAKENISTRYFDEQTFVDDTLFINNVRKILDEQ